MKIIIKSCEDEYGSIREELEINGKFAECVSPLCECPEDAIIGRSLISCSDIAGHMKRAYEAGVRGEEFTIESVPMEDD